MKSLWVHRCKTFFAYGSSAPVRVEYDGPLSCGDPGDAKCAGTGTASATGVMALSEFFFWASCSWQSEGLFGQPFSIALPIQTFRGLPCLGSFSVWHIRHTEGPPSGVLLCRLVHQALKGAPWVESYSVVQGVRRLMGQSLCCSASDAGMWGERGFSDGSIHYMWLSSIALLPWLPCFPPQAFPTTVSSLTSPPFASLWSTAALTLGLLHNP